MSAEENIFYNFNENPVLNIDETFINTIFGEDTTSSSKTLTLTASIDGGDVNPASIKIIINREIETVNPSIEEIIENSPPGAFPTGQSDTAFSILYYMDEDLTFANGGAEDFDKKVYLETLNSAAKEYMKYYYQYDGDDTTSPDAEVGNYYGIDDDGVIYCLISSDVDLDEDEALNYYGNEVVKGCYKVPISGYCRIVDVDNTAYENGNLICSNGYCLSTIEEGKQPILRLFLNTEMGLINKLPNDLTTDTIPYSYNEDEAKNILVYNKNGIYYKERKYEGIYTLPVIDADNPTTMITGGTTRYLILPSLVREVSYLYGGSNMDGGIVINSQLKRIGDYCFYGAKLSSEISLNLEVAQIESIGNYAFADTSNFYLWKDDNNNTSLPASLIEIGNYAFAGMPCHSAGFDISNCSRLETVGEGAFGIKAVSSIIYAEEQVEEDEDSSTSLIYLPPSVLQASIVNKKITIKTSGKSLLTSGINSTYTAKEYETLKNAITDNIDTEITNGQSKKTFFNAELGAGVTWTCK